jgi:hypothetical protein
VTSQALRHLVVVFYFSQYNGPLHDFNVITSVKCVCVCVCVCVELRKLVSIGWHGNGCSDLCMGGSRGLGNLMSFKQYYHTDTSIQGLPGQSKVMFLSRQFCIVQQPEL